MFILHDRLQFSILIPHVRWCNDAASFLFVMGSYECVTGDEEKFTLMLN